MGIYEALEERYYSFLDWLDEHGIPLWKLAQPIEAKGIPSFPIFAGIALAILVGIGWGIYTLFFGPKVYVVTVLDPNGNPIAGAVVSVGGETYRTGPDGTVELELKGDEQIIIMATGYEDTLVTAEELSEPVVLKPLVRKATIFVVDTDGRPVSATVKVFGKNGEREFQGSRIEFNVARVETDDAVVMGSSLRVEVTADGYEKTVTTITWDAPAKTVRLRKEKPPSATLYIFTDPPANGWIYLMSGLTTVDRALLKSGKATFYGVQYGYYTFRVVPIVDGKKYEDPEGRNTFDVEVRAPRVQKYVEIYVPDVNEVKTSRVHILDANTLEPLRATVFVVEMNATYNVDGLFEIQMKRGTTFTLNISAPKYKGKTVKLQAGDDVNVLLERAPAVGSIVVEVQDIHNRPIAGVSVTLLDLNNNVVAEANAPTDDEGKAYFSDILVGQYVAEACMGSVCARSKPFEVEEDKIVHVPVLLVPGYGSVSVTLTVDGVPSSGKIRLVRISTGETVKEGDIGLDGRGKLDEVPAYIRMRAEVSALGITYVSPAFFLLPHETRHMDVELQSEGEPGFQILGVYVGGARVGVVEGGKRYTLKISFFCEGNCSENFSIENGLFLDTDWPGRYTIGDANGTAEAGHELNVSLTCDGKCMGTFDVDINVDVASFGEKLVIKHGENIFSVPIAYEGTCSGDLCAFVVFARKGNHISPFDLYEELKYDMNLGIVWGGKTIENAILRIVPSGPANIEINGETEYETRGRLESGAYISLSGAAYSPDPGTETLDIVVSTCDPAYVNCTDVGSLTLSAHFSAEPDGEVTIIPDPDFFVGCPFTLTLSLIDENGEPVVFDSETMIFKAFGVTEEGVKTSLSYSWESDRITVSFNGADYDSVEVHFDGFGYAEAEARVFRSDPQLEPETYPGGEDVDVGDTLTFVFQNSSDMNLHITGILRNLPGLDTEVRSEGCRGEGVVLPNSETSIELEVRNIIENYVGEQQTGTLEVFYTPAVEGVSGECSFTAVAPATYTPLPSCLKVSAYQVENSPNVEVNVTNTCQSICPTQLEVTATTSDYRITYNCFKKSGGSGECAVDPGNQSAIFTCRLEGSPDEEASGWTVKVTAIAQYDTGTEERRSTTAGVIYVPQSCRGQVTFNDEIDPNEGCVEGAEYTCEGQEGCKCTLEANGVQVGTIEPGTCAFLNGLKIDVGGKEYAYYTPGWFNHPQNKCCGFCNSTAATNPLGDEYISQDSTILLLTERPPSEKQTSSEYEYTYAYEPYIWYGPFPLGKDETATVSVTVYGYFSLGYDGPWAFYDINTQQVTLKGLDITCEDAELSNNTCGPIIVSLGKTKYAAELPAKTTMAVDNVAAIAVLGIEKDYGDDYSSFIENVCKNGLELSKDLYLVRDNSYDKLGNDCTADKIFAILEAQQVNIENAYPVTIKVDPCDPDYAEAYGNDCQIYPEPQTGSADHPYFQIVATENAGTKEIKIELITDSGASLPWYKYDDGEWTPGQPTLDLTGPGYEFLAQLVLEGPESGSCSTINTLQNNEQLKVPIEVLITDDGSCYALGAQTVESGSNARIWGYGELQSTSNDCASNLSKAGFTIWQYSTTDTLEQLPNSGIVFDMPKNAGASGVGFISQGTLDTLGLKEGIHYSLASEVEDVKLKVDSSAQSEITCKGDGTLYGIFWKDSGTVNDPNTDCSSGDCHALFLCLPNEGIYDPNLFNNAYYDETYNSSTTTINTDGGQTCTCSTPCGDIGPGEQKSCVKEEDGQIKLCTYTCSSQCETEGGCVTKWEPPKAQ